jgi:riboflavin synthase
VQGHVNAAVPIRELKSTPGNVYLTVEVPPDLRRYCVREGSVALDGISLTTARIEGGLVTVNIIPATVEGTVLRYKRAGDYMNLETDILARYVESFMHGGSSEGGLTVERMMELGY